MVWFTIKHIIHHEPSTVHHQSVVEIHVQSMLAPFHASLSISTATPVFTTSTDGFNDWLTVCFRDVIMSSKTSGTCGSLNFTVWLYAPWTNAWLVNTIVTPTPTVLIEKQAMIVSARNTLLVMARHAQWLTTAHNQTFALLTLHAKWASKVLDTLARVAQATLGRTVYLWIHVW